jgi:uncharacterized membrane protein HdeD (DUF308 family)
MLEILAANWWMFVLRGAFGVLFGLVTLFVPFVTFFALVILFAVYALMDGVVSLFSAVRRARRHERWGALVLEGAAGIAAGILTLLWPQISALALLYVVAAWAVVTGVFEIAAAVRLRKEIRGEWLLALGGIVSIAFGALLVLLPGAGALALTLWIGAYALVFGATLIGLGVRLRLRQSHAAGPPHHHPAGVSA